MKLGAAWPASPSDGATGVRPSQISGQALSSRWGALSSAIARQAGEKTGALADHFGRRFKVLVTLGSNQERGAARDPC